MITMKPGTWVAIKTDKNGNEYALRYIKSSMRWVRMNLDDAKLAISLGIASETK